MFNLEVMMLDGCKANMDKLNDWEKNFINDLSEMHVNYQLTVNQLKSLRSAYLKVQGGGKWGDISIKGGEHEGITGSGEGEPKESDKAAG